MSVMLQCHVVLTLLQLVTFRHCALTPAYVTAISFISFFRAVDCAQDHILFAVGSRPVNGVQQGVSLTEAKDVLYICAINAKRNNIACKALYERLIAKGKSGKLALIAVCNKLLSQVFAVVETILPINPITAHLNLKINIEKCLGFYTVYVVRLCFFISPYESFINLKHQLLIAIDSL